MSFEHHRDEHVDEDMLVMQVNLDDMNPELYPYIGELLLGSGANDVWWIPIIMKKGRPGVMLNVLASRSLRAVLEEIIFRETTTLGLRVLPAACHRLGRRFVQVETPWGDVTVKVGILNGEEVQFAPEFRECEEAAKRAGIPLKQVYDEVRRRYLEQVQEQEQAGR